MRRTGVVVLIAAALISVGAAMVVAQGSPRRMSLPDLGSRLAQPVATTILVQGDSTGAAPTRWVHRFTAYLAATNPTLTVRYHAWNQQTQTSFLTAQTIQRGSSRGTLNVWNASMPGAITAYTLNQHFRQQTAMPHVDAVFINYSHNDATVTDYGSLFTALAKADRRRYPQAMIVGLTQNPEFAPRPAPWVAMEALHAGQIRAVCHANGYELVDTYTDFERAVRGSGHARYVAADDGVHPTDAGDRLWVSTVERWFNRAA